MKIQPSCMMNQIHCQHIVHIRKTGKMTKKEARNLASKNKSILNWVRPEEHVPDGWREEVDQDEKLGNRITEESENSTSVEQEVSIVKRKALSETDEHSNDEVNS